MNCMHAHVHLHCMRAHGVHACNTVHVHVMCNAYRLQYARVDHGCLVTVITWARRIYVRTACRPSQHASWTCYYARYMLRGNLHIMYIHAISRVERKYRYHTSFVCVRFSRGEGVGEKRLVLVSKKTIGIYG